MGSMDPDLTTLTLLLARVARLSESVATEVCTTHGTTSAELRVLSMLSHRPDGAGSPSDIARWVVQTSGGLTATLKRLEDDGYVERRPDPDDGRGRLVALTDDGKAFHDRLLADLVGRVDGVLAGVDTEAALAAIRDLAGALERAAGLPSSDGFVAGIPSPTTSHTSTRQPAGSTR